MARTARFEQAVRARWPVAAIDVALLRIVLAGIVASTAEVGRAVQLAAGSTSHWQAPNGLGWFVRTMPLDLGTASLIRQIHLSAALLVGVGLYTRPALLALTLSSFYLFAMNQLSGAVLHDMHLLWFLLLLVLTRPADALSLDRWFATRGEPWRDRVLGDPTPRFEYALPMAILGTWLGLIYFFPGAWKLSTSGPAWALSDNVILQMHAKWLQHGVVPTPRVDLHPRLVQLGACCALAFELGFVFLVQIGPRVRVALLLAGVMFHLSIQRFLLIPFASLWLCYVGLVPWSALLRRRLSEPAFRQETGRSSSRALGVIAALCTLAILERGVRGITQSYPFACYPTFDKRVAPTLQDLRVVVVGPRGEREVPIAQDPYGHREQAAWGTIWSLAGIYGPAFSEARLAAYLHGEPHVRASCTNDDTLRVELVTRATAPERWKDPAKVLRTLASLPCAE